MWIILKDGTALNSDYISEVSKSGEYRIVYRLTAISYTEQTLFGDRNEITHTDYKYESIEACYTTRTERDNEYTLLVQQLNKGK
jgi:hypothetical protein